MMNYKKSTEETNSDFEDSLGLNWLSDFHDSSYEYNESLLMISPFQPNYIPCINNFIADNIQLTNLTKSQDLNENINISSYSKKFSGKKRKSLFEINAKSHTKDARDNIQRKIQVHSLNFIVIFINEILTHLNIKEKFINISYEFKKKINSQFVSKLKIKKIGEILCQKISPKNKIDYSQNKDKNVQVYNKVIENRIVKEILSETYLNVFRHFYLSNKRNINNYNGLNFTLSKKAKTFDDILNNKKVKDDEEYKEKIIEIIKKEYLPQKIFKIDYN